MVHDQLLQLKMKSLLGYNMKIVIQWGKLAFGGDKNLVGESLFCGGRVFFGGESFFGEGDIFQVGGMSKFSASTPFPPLQKTWPLIFLTNFFYDDQLYLSLTHISNIVFSLLFGNLHYQLIFFLYFVLMIVYIKRFLQMPIFAFSLSPP